VAYLLWGDISPFRGWTRGVALEFSPGLAPDQIRTGLAVLGRIIRTKFEAPRAISEPSLAMV
jgi:hypothetical protein